MSYFGTEVLSQSTIQERRATVRIGWGDLQQALVGLACNKIERDPSQVSAKLTVEQETEGSPSYSVQRWRAMVVLVQNISNGDPGDLRATAIEEPAPGVGDKLLTIAREFIDKHHVSCAEATGNDGVYEEAPLLVKQLAEVAGYYTYPDGDA